MHLLQVDASRHRIQGQMQRIAQQTPSARQNHDDDDETDERIDPGPTGAQNN
jgi:hypothetical protein